jgi:capsular polysaccharide biosynthesis protein
MMDAHVPPAARTPPVFSNVVRRRWRLLVLCTILALVAAWAYDYTQPPRYVSTASVLVTPIEGGDSAQPLNGQRQRGQLNLATEAQLVTSTAVAAAAGSALNGPETVNELIGAVSTNIPDESSIIEISFEATTARQAQRGAEAFATAYLEHRERTARSNLEEQITSVETQIVSIREELADASAAVASATPGSPEAVMAEASADLLTSQLSALSRTLGTLQATSTTPGRVINSAYGTAESSGPPLLVLLAGGAVLGLLLGSALALLRERTDRRVRSAADVEGLVGLPVVSLGDGGRMRPLALVETHSSTAGRVFRRFRNSVMSSLPGGARLIVVTGAGPDHASRRVAVNIAAALARGDCSVVFVDACSEVRRERDRATEPAPGLSDVLSGGHRLSDVIRPVKAIANLRWIGVGRDPEGLTQQLQRRAAAAIVAGLKDSNDFVVVHTAPATVSPDAQTVARWADVGVVVVEAGRTRGAHLTNAVDQLHEVRLTQLWCMLTRPQPRPGIRDNAAEESMLGEALDDGLAGDLASLLGPDEPDGERATSASGKPPVPKQAHRAGAGPARPG